MLETVHRPGPPLAVLPDSNDFADAAGPADLIAATQLPDGSVAMARCLGTGQHLSLFLLHRVSGWNTGTVETVEAKKQVASSGIEVTAMKWFQISDREHLLCVGFSHGGVSIFTPRGAVCLSFLIEKKPVLRIRTDDGSTEGSQQGLLLLHEGGVLAIVELDSLRSVVYGSPVVVSEEGGGAGVRFRVYELRGRAEIQDACWVDKVQQLEDVFSMDTKMGVAALGTRPFLSLHTPAADAASSRSLIGTAASALTSYAKSFLPFRRGNNSDPLAFVQFRPAGALRASELQLPPQGPPEELPVAAKFIDPTRTGDRLEPAPHRHPTTSTALAVTCDAFGRVGLFCIETLRCFHLWKGYRDAQVAWLYPCDYPERVDRIEFCLVIYAPLRGLLELWDVTGAGGPQRADAAAVDLNCSLLSSCGQVYLLRPSGRFDRVRWHRKPCSPLTAGGAAAAPSQPGSDAFASPRSCADGEAVQPPEPDAGSGSSAPKEDGE
mmetsp:Transcript_19774/g.49689  ORF Transcript_19774/g.49689 Transcript_19774/m.49689 type:complete len:492 (+) Transcript_19774:90-1565(+)